MSDSIRVLIADDHPLFREGVAHSLASEPDFEVVGQVSGGEAALELARELVPDVVLLDITMPGQGGLVAAGRIAAACPATRIVMLTVSQHEDDLLEAFKAGARAYVLKGVSVRELFRVLRAVVAGEVYVAPSLAARILVEHTHFSPPPDPLDQLTEREREVLMLLAEGLSNRQIGARLHLAEKTIKGYMSNVLQKLHVRSRVEAALLTARER
ncbi:MAG: response regulator transcription factor [Candidatus Lambdaproteobacteria bacterium]|nr:response regulator transcription factor [Candidatus Lambdaproteobacteria bacterium]